MSAGPLKNCSHAGCRASFAIDGVGGWPHFSSRHGQKIYFCTEEHRKANDEEQPELTFGQPAPPGSDDAAYHESGDGW